ncbi:MAG: hypothetical protein Q9200_006095 [Gallowayella weberi]
MANFFSPDQSSSLPYPPDRSLLEAHPQSLGINHIHEYANHQTPSYPHFDTRETHLPLPKHGFSPQQPEPPPQNSSEIPPVAMVSPEVDYNHRTEDFHPYNPEQKPEARSNRGLLKQATPAQSPEGKPSSNGRRRTRTKVVAWDPNDLEDIYRRKEINKEEWDTICRDYPSRTRVAMRQQVIKLREKKHREAMGLGNGAGKSSTYSDSPQPASNGIKWASVNGYQSSPADADLYPQRQSVDDDESSDDFELSSAPDSDPEGKTSKHLDPPARSTPLPVPGSSLPDAPSQQPVVPSMPIITQEGPQNVAQVQPNFDVLAAQSRGQPIAPRQTPPQPHYSMPTGPPDGRPPPPPPLPPPPEFRPTLRTKRARDFEAVESEARPSNQFGKRRKHMSDFTDPPHNRVSMGPECPMPFNPSQSLPLPSLPPRVPLDSELDEMCIRFRDTFRMMKAYYDEEFRISKDLYDASLGRANARATLASHRIDETSLALSEQNKEVRLLSQLELDRMHQKLTEEQSETQKLRDELAKCRYNLTVTSETLERKKAAAAIDNSDPPDSERAKAPEPSSNITLEQKLRAAQEDSERADAANHLLEAKMRLDGRDIHSKIQEVKKQHDVVTGKIDHLVSQDLQDWTNKEIKKLLLDVKEQDGGLSDKLKEVEDFLERPEHLTFASTSLSTNPVANGSTAGDHT